MIFLASNNLKKKGCLTRVRAEVNLHTNSDLTNDANYDGDLNF